MKLTANRTLRGASWAAWVGLALLASAATGLSAQPSADLNHPRNPVAQDSGVWNAASELEFLSFANPGERFCGNFYDTFSISNVELWHAQHVVRLLFVPGRSRHRPRLT